MATVVFLCHWRYLSSWWIALLQALLAVGGFPWLSAPERNRCSLVQIQVPGNIANIIEMESLLFKKVFIWLCHKLKAPGLLMVTDVSEKLFPLISWAKTLSVVAQHQPLLAKGRFYPWCGLHILLTEYFSLSGYFSMFVCLCLGSFFSPQEIPPHWSTSWEHIKGNYSMFQQPALLTHMLPTESSQLGKF